MKMKRIIIRSPGSYEKLEIENLASRKPEENEVKIACKACGINFADCCVRMGVYSSAKNAVIDKSSVSLWEEAKRLSPDGYRVILDANGVETLKESYHHLCPSGKLVVYGFHTMFSKGRGTPNWIKMAWDWLRTPSFNPLEMTGANKSVLAFNLSYLFDRKQILQGAIDCLGKWIEEGKIQPPKVAVYPFEKVADAHRDLESGKTVGKLVLEIE